MSKTLYLKAQLAEAKGEIDPGQAAQVTYAAIVASAVQAAAEGYYGTNVLNLALSNAKVEQMSEDTLDSMLEDISDMRRVLNETHTTTDFPLALANLRQRTLRAAYEGTAPTWRSWVRPSAIITVSDFKTIRGLRVTELPELKARAEGTDVQYASFGETEDGYRVANFERALKYTWEMWLNDEVGMFARALASYGRGAYRTEQIVIFEAIAAGLVRSTENGLTAGVPDIARIQKMRQALTNRAFIDSDGKSVEYGYDITDFVFGTANRDTFTQTLNQNFVGGDTQAQTSVPNPVKGAGTAHMERLWSRVFGTDYIGFDADADWLEVAFLESFQGGPLFYTKMPDTDQPSQGSFSNHSLEVKVGHTLGAKVVDQSAAIRVQGV